ncbi:MAG: ABC transporter substrate-binding protein [Halanaerobium sp.]|nr:ABC transporter substrate-binding protein [Halanaerobium sp.]
MKKVVSLLLLLILVLGMSVVSFATEEPVYGGTFIFGRGADSPGLDPIKETDGETYKVTEQIYDTLVDYKPGTTEVIPALATSWEVSDDGKVWTFNLREGVQFHDGTPFNAEAVVWNFDRWGHEDHPYHQGSFDYYTWMFMGFPGLIQDVQAVDDLTVRFVLSEPQAPFLANLAMSPFAIASPTAVKKWGEDSFKHPVGTGPFVFQEWVQDDQITLVRNEKYWGDKPYLDKVVFRVIPDPTARVMELQTGKVDFIDGVTPDSIPVLENDEKLKILLRPSMNVGYMAMNQAYEPLDNVLVRRAINYAIDNKALVDSVFMGMAVPAKNPMPPSIWGYNDEIEGYDYDPEKARELLEEAGYPDGFKTKLWAMPNPRPYMPQPRLIAQIIQAYLAEVGIDIEIISMDWSTYLTEYKKNKAPMYLLGWTGDNGDPDNFLYVLLDPANDKDKGNYQNEEVHQLLVEAQTTMDHEKRVELYKKAQELIFADAPWVNIAHSTPPLAAKQEVMGYVPSPTGVREFTKVWKK